jgi:hypothetical protein
VPRHATQVPGHSSSGSLVAGPVVRPSTSGSGAAAGAGYPALHPDDGDELTSEPSTRSRGKPSSQWEPARRVNTRMVLPSSSSMSRTCLKPILQSNLDEATLRAATVACTSVCLRHSKP